jgi:hypothetical protein
VTTALSILALLIALGALAVSLQGRRAAAGRARADGASDLPHDALGLRREVAALRAEVGSALRNLAVVRYDAFPDMGGHLSWSLALVDDQGDGVVLTSIHGRNDARSYAKAVASWRCEQPLSPVEEDAISRARPSASAG